jgi:hypothetical protein
VLGVRFVSVIAGLNPVFLCACLDLGALNTPVPPPVGCDGGGCDASTKVDAVAPAGDAATVCKPGDVTTFKPQWKPPTGSYQGRCTSTQVDSFLSCLFSQAANDQSCLNYINAPANAICSQCLLSDETDSAYGPLVKLGTEAIVVNVEGCVSLVENNATASSCGAKAQALAQCKEAACTPSCPLTNHAELVAFNDCEQAAESTSCKSYYTAAACLMPLINTGGAAENCTHAPTPLDAAISVAKLFCM